MDKLLNKKALTDSLTEKFGFTKKKSEEIVNAIFNEMKSTLEEQGTVDIYGFGKFEIVHHDEREGINPRTKEKMIFAASNSVKFKSSKALKDAVNK